MVNLRDLFEEFCNAADGKLRWGDSGKLWTDFVFDFLRSYMKKIHPEDSRLEPESNYMSIDLVFRTPWSSFIELAVESENTAPMKDFMSKELRHLADLKAESKIAIYYPSMGDEDAIVERAYGMIRERGPVTRNLGEDWLLLFGFSTTTSGHKIVLWRGHFISGYPPSGNFVERQCSQRKAPLTATP